MCTLTETIIEGKKDLHLSPYAEQIIMKKMEEISSLKAQLAEANGHLAWARDDYEKLTARLEEAQAVIDDLFDFVPYGIIKAAIEEYRTKHPKKGGSE